VFVVRTGAAAVRPVNSLRQWKVCCELK